VRWLGAWPSLVHWSCLDEEAIHGHGGATRIMWIDEWEVPRAEAA
jgi:hypothetical protein